VAIVSFEPFVLRPPNRAMVVVSVYFCSTNCVEVTALTLVSVDECDGDGEKAGGIDRCSFGTNNLGAAALSGADWEEIRPIAGIAANESPCDPARLETMGCGAASQRAIRRWVTGSFGEQWRCESR
jgi:hypothetical protein